MLFDDNRTQNLGEDVQGNNSSTGKISPRFEQSQTTKHQVIKRGSLQDSFGDPVNKEKNNIIEHRGSLPLRTNDNSSAVSPLVEKKSVKQISAISQSTLLMELARVEEDLKSKTKTGTISP